MKKFDSSFEKELEKTIADIEEQTSVEVVACITPSSDSYMDAYYKGGIIALLVMLAFILYSPFIISEYMIPIDLAVSFVAGMLAVKLFPPLRRILVSKKRREEYVHHRANAWFRENGLTETIERTALLIYISVFEKKCRLIADTGILTALPASDWKEMQQRFEDGFATRVLPDTIIELLPTITTVLSECLPPAEDNIDELSNTLRRVE